ncbi:MAG: putative acyltransferase, partial [Pseudonocardiales bacterium]|nr:putative acyltransferase [Pseudonocardiales bacterium]
MTTVLAPTTATPTTGSTLERTPRSFRPDVEGLRAVAVGLVVLYHAGVGWIPGGYVGVDVFFVISGYLITGLLLREFDADGRIALVDFYARRARRILPIAGVVIIATVGASSIFLSSIRLNSVAKDGLWTSVFGANFHFAASGADYLNATAPPSPLQHYWSLAVEEQFYVVWPLLLWLALSVASRRSGRVTRNGRAAMIAGAAVAASIIWSILQTSSDANAAYFSPFTRGWELGAGALVAICAVGLARIPRPAAAALGWIGLGLIVYSAFVFDSRTPFPGSAALVPVLGAVCVLVGGLTLVTGGPEAVLATRPMQQIGRYSFSLYLLHWPILVIAEGRNPDIGLTTKLILVLFSLGLAALTFHLVENPVRRMPRLTRSATASLLVGALTIGCALAYSKMYVVGDKFVVQRAEQLFNLQNAGTDTSVPVTTVADVVKAVAAAAVTGPVSKTVTPAVAEAGTDKAPAYDNGCLAAAVDITSPDCTFGSTNSADPLVVLFGDSSAVQWSPALASLAAVSDFRFKIIAKEACPASAVTVLNPATNLIYPQCDTWRTWAFGELTRLKPSVVIVAQDRVEPAGSTSSTRSSWAAGLTQTLTTLTALGSKVSVFSAAPKHRVSAPV